MSAESNLDLVRSLITAVARPSTTPAHLETVLAEAGYPNPAALVTRLPAGRYGTDFRFTPGQPVPLAELEHVWGPARSTRSLDGDGGAERYWDVAVGGSEHVVLIAVLDPTETMATAVRLTPYSL